MHIPQRSTSWRSSLLGLQPTERSPWEVSLLGSELGALNTPSTVSDLSFPTRQSGMYLVLCIFSRGETEALGDWGVAEIIQIVSGGQPGFGLRHIVFRVFVPYLGLGGIPPPGISVLPVTSLYSLACFRLWSFSKQSLVNGAWLFGLFQRRALGLGIIFQ